MGIIGMRDVEDEGGWMGRMRGMDGGGLMMSPRHKA